MASHVIRKTTKDDLRKQVGSSSEITTALLKTVTEEKQMPKGTQMGLS